MKMLLIDYVFKNLLPRENTVRLHPTIFNGRRYENDAQKKLFEDEVERFRHIADEMGVPLGKGAKDGMARGRSIIF